MSGVIRHVLQRPDGVRLQLREWPRAGAPCVVLVHGYPDCSHIWDACIDSLRREFHVLAYDVRGAGASSRPRRLRDYRLERLAGDLAAVIDHGHAQGPVHLVGHDWGSIQSWEAVTDPALAERFASYTSISGPCLDHVGHWLRARAGSDWPAVLTQLRHSWYIAAFQLPLLAPAAWSLGLDRVWPGLLQRLEGMGEVAAQASQRRDGRNGVNLYRANMLPRLLRPRARHCPVPVQLIVPEQDPFVFPTLFEDLQRWVGQLEYRRVDAGHWLPLSQPDWLAARIGDFVRRQASRQQEIA